MQTDIGMDKFKRPEIVGGEDLARRRDNRTSQEMQDKLDEGYLAQHAVHLALETLGRTVVALPENDVDANPDLTIFNPNTNTYTKAEVQYAVGWWNCRHYYNAKYGFQKTYGVHVKDSKIKKIEKLLQGQENVLLIQVVAEEVFFLDMSTWSRYKVGGKGTQYYPVRAKPMGYKKAHFFTFDDIHKMCMVNQDTQKVNALYPNLRLDIWNQWIADGT